MKLFFVDCSTPFGGDGLQDVFLHQSEAQRCADRLTDDEQDIHAWIIERDVCVCDMNDDSGCEACCGPDLTAPFRKAGPI